LGLRREPCLAGTAILKTPVDGVSKVIIFIGDKTGKLKPSALQFFVLPTAAHHRWRRHHPFGEHPYAEFRAMAQARAMDLTVARR